MVAASKKSKKEETENSSEERLIRSDPKAEAIVLASILENKDIFDSVSDRLKEEYFFSNANRHIYRAMIEIVKKGDEISLPSVRDWLFDNDLLKKVEERYLEYELFGLTPVTVDPGREADRIIKHFQVRQMQGICKEFIAKSSYLSMDSIPEAITDHEKSIIDIGNISTEASIVPLMSEVTFTYTDRLQKRLFLIDKIRKEGKSFIELPTGIDKLDMMTGGLHRGEVVVVAARPGMGKTSLAIKTINSLSGKLNYSNVPIATAIFSLEMPQHDIYSRFVCCEADIDIKKLRTSILDEAETRVFTNGIAKIYKKPIAIVDRANTLMEIRNTIKKAKMKFNKIGQDLAVVAIDYLQLIDDDKSNKNYTRNDSIGQISRSFKTLAISENICIILLSQLNRDVESTKDKRPSLSNLRESGAIEQDADVVIFLLRKEYYWPNNNDYKGLCELIISKQRNGPTGSVLAGFENKSARFYDLYDSVGYDDFTYEEDFEKWNKTTSTSGGRGRGKGSWKS